MGFAPVRPALDRNPGHVCSISVFPTGRAPALGAPLPHVSRALQVLGGARVAFAPGSFMQANFEAMNAALAAIAAHVPAGSAVADLHCGVGTIGHPRRAFDKPRKPEA